MSALPQKPPTPQEAYNKARALEQANHRYTTEGVHVVCACTYVGTVETIAKHVEDYAEAAGRAARDAEVQRRAKEYEEKERARQRREQADYAARLAREQAGVEQQ